MALSPENRILRLAKRRGVIRPRDVREAGIPDVYLYRLRDEGKITQLGRGLFQLADAPMSEHQSLAAVSKRVSHGVVCLLSALQFHELTTQSPPDVWLAIDNKARKPTPDYPPIRIVRMNEDTRLAGVATHKIGNVSVPITTPAKTVVDCFRYRNKIGIDVAIEALRDYMREHGDLRALRQFAETCRVANVMRPYMETVA